MTINEWAKEIHENAIKHGWWEGEKNFGEIIALCHSELSEALEEERADKPAVYTNEETKGKPEGKYIEMIDCIIRILDYLASENVDIEYLLSTKHNYNITRPYKHGKVF